MEPLLIRAATRADEPVIQQVIKSVYDAYGWGWFPDGYHSDLYHLDAHYFDSGHLFWVAQLGDEVVGTCALHLFDPVPGTGVVRHQGFNRIGGADCSLERLYVIEHARGHRVGLRLFQTSVHAARERARKRMEIWSDKDLTVAHAMYKRAGAVIIGERKCHDPSEAPEFGMQLDLDSAQI